MYAVVFPFLFVSVGGVSICMGKFIKKQSGTAIGRGFAFCLPFLPQFLV